MIINHNLMSMNALSALNSNNSKLQSALQHLSSGKRINSAADDAAGLAISEKMKGQINGLDQASRNAQDGISMIQTGEGALNETHSILQRMRDLATQSANDTNTTSDRQNIQQEVDQLAQEMTRISNTTQFNGQTLLNGGLQSSALGADTFQIGANSGQTIQLSIGAMDAKSLGVARDVKGASLTGSATNVMSATLSPVTGAAVVPGASLGLTATATAAVAADATTKLGTVGNTSQYNGYAVTVATGGAVGSNSFAIDNTNKTITINLDTATTTQALANTAIQSFQGGSAFQFSAVPVAGTGSLTGGLGSDEVKLSLNSGANTETTIVKNNASSATFSDPTKFAGVTLNFSGTLSASTAATVKISTATATAATFASGQKTGDGVAAGGIDVSSSSTAASNAITTIDTAIQTVSAERSALGAYQNRLDHTINNLDTSSQNLTSASSRITDVDMAAQMAEFTKDNVLQQAAVSMLAQANQQPQMVLKLLG
jgi:flagellin